MRIKHSAVFEIQQRPGVRFAGHYGWEVPASYGSAEREAATVRRGVGLADVSWMGKFDLKGFGLRRGFSLGPGVFCWVLGSLHFLATCEPPARNDVLGPLTALRTTGADLALPPPVYITDVTSVYAQFVLAGPRSRDVLRKLSSFNISETSLANLACGQTSLAHVRTILLRKDIGSIPAFHLLVSREYGESVWESVLHAGHEFEIAAFGLQAQGALDDEALQ